MIESKTQELHVKIEQVDSMKEAKEGKLAIIYSLPNAEGQLKKNNEVYEITDKEIFVKTFNALKEKIVLSSPRKLGLMRINSGGGSGGGFNDNVLLKGLTTPQVKARK